MINEKDLTGVPEECYIHCKCNKCGDGWMSTQKEEMCMECGSINISYEDTRQSLKEARKKIYTESRKITSKFLGL